MAFNVGDVVMLKSGGQALTVASVEADAVTCIWIGEQGDLFREAIPAATLSLLDLEEDEEDAEHDETDADEDDEEASDARA
jgi:uncharacterized protein YodC (DUF2158 family)